MKVCQREYSFDGQPAGGVILPRRPCRLRDLVRDCPNRSTRIEMKQIGVAITCKKCWMGWQVRQQLLFFVAARVQPGHHARWPRRRTPLNPQEISGVWDGCLLRFPASRKSGEGAPPGKVGAVGQNWGRGRVREMRPLRKRPRPSSRQMARHRSFTAADVEGPATGGKRTGCSCAMRARLHHQDKGAAGDAEQPPAEGRCAPRRSGSAAASRPAIKHSSLQATHTSVRSISHFTLYATMKNRPPESFWRPLDCYIIRPRGNTSGSERACQRFRGWLVD